jgi:hypothetical protein
MRVPALLLVAGVLALPAGADDKPMVVKVNKLSAAAPAGWKSEKPANRLRSFQFKLPGAADHADAELIVSPESSPDVQKNFPRYKAQFVPPEGKTAEDLGKTAKWDVPGETVNVLDVTGTWKYKERPFDPKSKEMLLENYRVIWVIVADKDEATHLRLSGPAPSVDKHAAEFEKWVKSLK